MKSINSLLVEEFYVGQRWKPRTSTEYWTPGTITKIYEEMQIVELTFEDGKSSAFFYNSVRDLFTLT